MRSGVFILTLLGHANGYLFHSLSNNPKGRKFENEEEIKRDSKNYFDEKSKEFYTRGICDLPRRWEEVIDTNGELILDR